jgi:hypothetical protein
MVPHWIVLISKPRAPGSLFKKIESYQKGMGTMFSTEQKECEHGQPYFAREYCRIYSRAQRI